MGLQNSDQFRRAEDVNLFYELGRTCSADTVSKKGGGFSTAPQGSGFHSRGELKCAKCRL